MRHVSQNETILAGFLPWVETQSGPYDYYNSDNCALARYLKAIGVAEFDLGPWEIGVRYGKGVEDALAISPHNYAALAERLRQCAKPVSEREGINA